MTIPSNDLSIISRKKLYSAMKLSSLNPTHFVHENTASAAYQAMPWEPKEKEEYYSIFINVGAYYTKLSLFKFNTTEGL